VSITSIVSLGDDFHCEVLFSAPVTVNAGPLSTHIKIGSTGVIFLAGGSGVAQNATCSIGASPGDAYTITAGVDTCVPGFNLVGSSGVLS
jgi:hypothetical protein